MFEEMVVRYRNDKGRREAVIPRGTGIRAVFLPGQSGADLAKEFGLNHVPGRLAPGITVRDENGVTLSAAALSAEFGPGMCCIKGGDLICW
jgi:hypothetical protein